MARHAPHLPRLRGRRGQDVRDARTRAPRRRERGTDVVVGFVETHGRPQTQEQIGDLEVIPRRRSSTADATFEEMDVDAILARAPEVALVDELAHTNVPGLAQREAVAGRRGAARGRDRRHLHRQHPASRVPERRRRAHHRRAAARDDPRRGRPRSGAAGARGHDPVRAATPDGARQHLSRRRRSTPRWRTTSARATSARSASSRCCGWPTASTRRCRTTCGTTASRGRGRRASGSWSASRARRGRAADPPGRAHGRPPRRRAARRPRDPGGRPRRSRRRGDARAGRAGRRVVPRGRRPEHAGGAARLRPSRERHADRARAPAPFAVA